MNYQEFLKNKNKIHTHKGFTPFEMNKNLFPFQKFIVERNISKAKHGVFADCGLGKTIMELETATQTVKKTNKKALILSPLVVVEQTKREADKFDFDLDKVVITNFDNLHKIDPREFSSLIVDESSIMKNFEGKLKKQIFDYFKNTDFKFAFTATPSPNDPMELGNHSEFLNYQSRLEMLATYFINDQDHTSKWRLKGHAIDKFYQSISNWALMLTKPGDIGFDMPGYELSEINYQNHKIETEKLDNGLLFNDLAISATDFNAELRRTKKQRIEKASELASNETNHIVWVKHNEESSEVTKMINGAIEVSGSDKPEEKAEKLLAFANNEFRVLVTKSKIAQYGLNFQNCASQIFMSLDFSFESLYQSIRRSHRFGQKNQVNINLITTDTMQNVISTIKTKEEQFKLMQQIMIKNQNIWNTKQFGATA
ncbi:helicase-related protein [Chryseobacterium mucoviscidosis]|uniref:helicase-related protein n=1 Tax=Chryseobacterium mucoviscidosis TaxID=1945581 RepID=UPI0030192BFE